MGTSTSVYTYICFLVYYNTYIYIFIYIIDEFSLMNACNLHSVILICDHNCPKPGIIQPDVTHPAGDPDILFVGVELPKAGAELVIVT